MDMTTFFAYARRAPFGGRLSQGQIDGINVLLEQWRYFGLTDRHWLAYVLATMFHETAATMQAVRETLLKSDAAVIKALDKAFAAGRLGQVKEPYWRPDASGKSWYGRGLVQITHRKNYETMGKRLDVDLVGNPSLALNPVIAARIIIVGMAEGLFTKRKLSDYFRPGSTDPVGARAIVNGTDKARLIAGYYKNFLDALDAAYSAKLKGVPADVSALDAKADEKPAIKSKTIWSIAGSMAGGGVLGIAKDYESVKDAAGMGASLLSAVSNPWAFGSVVFAGVGLGLAVWLITSGRLTIRRV